MPETSADGCLFISTGPRRMSTGPGRDVTFLAKAWASGEQDALNQLVQHVYAELHRLAHGYMRGERPGHALQTTALVNEAYLRLAVANAADCPDRRYFFGVCARLMRQILVDWARMQRSQKREGEANALELRPEVLPDPHSEPDLVAVDDALESLARLDPRKAQIVELRFFGGLTVDETAEALNVSPGTVARDWAIAKLFLRRELSRGLHVNLDRTDTGHGSRTLG